MHSLTWPSRDVMGLILTCPRHLLNRHGWRLTCCALGNCTLKRKQNKKTEPRGRDSSCHSSTFWSCHL